MAAQMYNRQLAQAQALHGALDRVAPTVRDLLTRNRDLLSVFLGARTVTRVRLKRGELGALFALADRVNAQTQLRIAVYPSDDGTAILAETRALARALNDRFDPPPTCVDVLGAASLLPTVELDIELKEGAFI